MNDPAKSYAELEKLYAAFNARDIDVALTGMREDVEWANGMEGGHVIGHAAVRAYWTRQWTQIDPRVEPSGFVLDDQGRIVVNVHAVVKDTAGKVLVDQMIRHAYTLDEGGRVRRFDILDG